MYSILKIEGNTWLFCLLASNHFQERQIAAAEGKINP
jgi:hypothetical protein